MEPAQAKPVRKRRRRRWLIVALLLVLASGVAWCWPRIDQSLVGKWKISGGPENYHVPLWLNPDGTGQVILDDSQRTLSRVFEWRVEAGYLVIFVPSRTGVRSWDRGMQRAYASTGSLIFLGGEQYAVHRGDSGKLHVAAWKGGGFLPHNCFLERIPE